ncbi:MAG: 4a-hydroxytetrahydrobiopterin dehydratase [Woeseiaceae bacterium]|nr:4a-hydroxytetrahydrobiopterin dehydratase [Woeseiaceae bacterium]NIP21051.1 4a-hydroxytetrahydrobiopterin dehydratase [Woeseiaceae bacterium]NIS90023.1 4a-hydroxytetrahydrobiopterin dehydratase [Woeseiaceae bacterium]
MTKKIVDKHCKPCEGGVDPLGSNQVETLMDALHEDWCVGDDGRTISRRFEFPAYSRTLGFVNAVAWIAITEGHHPDITFSYGYCEVLYTTHAIGGLSDNDFICAAKVDRLAAETSAE